MKNGLYPESYFLMRRSRDGYISATGMYKAAFPWSTLEEEQTERKFHKTLPSGTGEEVAGNVWISPDDALNLADEYAIRSWIIALLDPSPIDIGPKDKLTSKIATPPKFVASISDKDNLLPAPEMARPKRSASPAAAKAASQPSPRKLASPRKRGTRGASAKAEETKVEKTITKPSKVRDTIIENDSPVVNGDKAESKEKVASEAVVVDAKKEEPAPVKAAASRKRKASVSLTKEAENKGEGSLAAASAPKRQKTDLEEQLMTERVRSRALLGLTATLAIGAIVPYFL